MNKVDPLMSMRTLPVRLVGRSCIVRAVCLAAVLSAMMGIATAASPEPEYPFVGTWIRADRVCTAGAALVRTYTGKDVTSARGRCSIRRVVAGSGAYELQEECRRGERGSSVTETIRMTSPDSMTLRRQIVRLKIPRNVRYVRCGATPPARPPR